MSKEPALASRRAEIKCLTGLRIILALWVVIAHQTGGGGLLESFFALRWLHFLGGGTLAVSGFFCLSGFILAYNYSERLNTVQEKSRYLAARIARIYPVYFLGVAISAPFLIYNVTRHSLPAADMVGSLLACVLLVQAFWGPYCLIWDPPGWSLSAEFFFYITLPAYAARLRQCSTRGLVWILAGCLGYSFAVWGIGRMFGWGIFLIYNPLARVAEFAAGYLLGLLYIRRGPWSRAASGGGLGIATLLIILGLNALPVDNYFGVFVIAFLLIIYSLTNPPVAVSWVLGNRAALFLGEISYSVYIFHEPLALYFKATEKYILHTDLWSHHPVAAFIPYVMLVLLFSSVVFLTIEHPLRHRLAPMLARRVEMLLSRSRPRA